MKKEILIKLCITSEAVVYDFFHILFLLYRGDSLTCFLRGVGVWKFFGIRIWSGIDNAQSDGYSLIEGRVLGGFPLT